MTDQHTEWGYDGQQGPEHWGELDSTFSPCQRGKAQSPINLTHTNRKGAVNLSFDYHDMPLAIFNNGHTIQIACERNSSLSYQNERYNLVQFHFHHPSEHTIDGEFAAMELHLVHQHPERNEIVVIGVMLVEGNTDHAGYVPIFEHLPTTIGEPDLKAQDRIHPAHLLPADHTHFYAYEGSLTTPPCSEVVHWVVMADAVALSSSQIERFAALYDHNNRPIQPLNGRDLRECGI